MRIRRTLQISAVLGIFSVLLVAIMVMLLQIRESDHEAAIRNLNTAVRKITLIRGFLPDLPGLSRQRAVLQWHTQFAELTPILDAIPVLDEQARSLKLRILEEHAAVGALFDNLTRTGQHRISKEHVAIIGGLLDVRTASMVSDVLEMNDMTVAYINRQRRWVLAVTVASVAMLAGVIAGLLKILHGRVVAPIVRLEQETAMLSAGELERPILVAGNDEITALAASFESMRLSLRDRLIDLKAARALIVQENAKLAQRVEARTAELKSANRELDSFAYAVSHDLRGPLRAMSGFSQALLEDYGDQLSGDARIYLDQIDIASRHMGELIDGLLTLSRSTRAELQHDPIDLSDMANGILADLARLDPRPGMTITVEPGLAVVGDVRMIEVVLRNLLDNAWKYTQHMAQPAIRVQAEQKDGRRFVCVTDNGAGFDMAHAGKLFQPFQRLHRQEEFPGTGIGLATVQRIVHRHGGVMKVDGAPGKGATFCFSLSPAAEAGEQT